MSICPNCGATLNKGKLTLYCEYCGNVVNVGTKIMKNSTSPSDSIVKKHYTYFQENVDSIATNRYALFKTKGKTYTLESKPFYSNDGKLAKILTLFWQFKYQNDGVVETLLMSVTSNRPALRMTLRIDKDIFNLSLHKQDSKTAWFDLPMEVFCSLCVAKVVDINTDLKTDTNAQYNELPIFASRFYNAAFDKMKFVYSVNVKMITDQ